MTSSGIIIPDNDSCAFCAYLTGERPYTIAARTSQIAVLVTREQRGVPHLLVLPTAHYETIIELPDNQATALMLGVRQAARAIDATYKRPGIAIWQNNGIDADQAIAHVHFHVAGTQAGGGTDRGSVDEIGLAQTESIARRLRPHLQGLRS